MASGGQQNPSKGSLHSSENNTPNNGHNDNQWTFLPPPPNNLDLNSHPKPTKKHRNKEKIRSTTAAVPNSSTPPCVDHNSSNSLSLHGFPRTKFATASWLNDQLGGSGMFSKNESGDADELSSDVEHSISQRRNINMPVNHRAQGGRFKECSGTSSRKNSLESENIKTFKEDNTKKVTDPSQIFERLQQLRECVQQVNFIMPSLEKSDEPTAKEPINELSNMIKKLTEEEKENIQMLQHMLITDQSNNILNTAIPAEAAGSKKYQRHRDVHGNEEDKANIQNHFLEQVKESQEKLAALKQQQALLVSLQKQAEDKLAAFHAELAKSDPDQVHSDIERQHASSERSGVVDECAMNDDSEWENDVYQNPKLKKLAPNSQKFQNSGQEMLHPSVRQVDLQASSVEQCNNEHRKPWSQMIQDLSDKNLSEPVSDDDFEVTDVRKTLAEVEWKRKKLKNKLTELQEKKLLNDQLMVELSSLNEAAKSVGVGKFSEDEDAFSGSPGHNQHFEDLEDKKRKIKELQNTLMQLRGMMNGISPATNPEAASSSSSHHESKESTPMNFTVTSSPRNIPVSRRTRQLSSVKKDNISKEQSSGFPARRHYEAEGRANEDADIPSAIVTSNPPAPDQNSWDSDPRIQDKIRKIQEAKSKLKKIQGLMNSIEESKHSGQHMPPDYLQLLQTLEDEVKSDELDASDSEDSDVDRDDDVASINQSSSQAAVATAVKEIIEEKSKSLGPVDSRSDQSEQLHNQEKKLESLINERERLLKIHEQYVQLQNSLPSLQRTSNDHIRSCGEGGNLQKKKPHRFNASSTIKDSHQSWIGRTKDNLLTRQNVATMESQTRNDSNSLRSSSREAVIVKKENINNLSGKLTKHAPNSSVLSESLTQGNTDAFSTLSTELNQSISLRDEYKVQLSDIMMRKRQVYSSNQPSLIHSCSSINSELEGSNSAVAPDNTVAATWGGSSTQENFEDEGEEAIESLEEQDDEDEDENRNEDAAKNILEPRQNVTSFNHFPRKGAYVERGCAATVETRNNRNKGDFKGGMQTNRCSTKKNLPTHNSNRAQVIFGGSRPETYSPSEVTVQPAELEPITTAAPDNSTGSGMPPNFFQQVEQLNALCHSILEQQTLPQSHQRNLFCSLPLPNSCRPTHPISDVMHHYAQQLQLQQQLLLNLSQCYHALYMQQLEIQHLQRCMLQNSDPESSIPNTTATSMNPPVANTEDFTFRPWFLSPWLNSGIPSMPHPPSQISPMSAPPFLQPPQQSFTFSPPAAASSSPPGTLISGMQQARTVVSIPVDQEMRPNPETLNNRVPPRTRANNFLDNFRSYTRQNLLSASNNNTRSNEISGTAGVAQTRQFSTSVSNSGNWNCRASTEQIPSLENNVPTSQPIERSLERPPANPDLQELMTRTKKPNLNKPQTAPYSQHNPDSFRRPLASLNTLTPVDQAARSNPVHALNLESYVPSNASQTSVNLAQPYPQQQKSKIGQFPSASIAVPPPSASELVQESIYSEVSKLVSKNEFQPSSLRDFFQELQNLRSDGLQRALKTVQEMVKTEKSGCSSAINDDKIKNNNNEQDNNLHENTEQLLGYNQDIEVTEPRNSEYQVNRPTVDANKHWNNHGLPTATIPPLSNTHVPKSSTGAVKKKVSCKTTHACNYVSNVTHESQEANASILPPNVNSGKDPSELVVEKIALDIIPYLQNHIFEDCTPSLRSKLNSRILDVLKANYSSPLSCAFLSQLHQNLNLVMAKYSGLRICDCESDLLKNIAEMLFKELTLYKSASQRPDNGEVLGAASETSHQPDVLPQANKLAPVSEKKRTSDFSEVSRADSNFATVASEVLEDRLCDTLLKISVDENSNNSPQLSGLLQQETIRGAVGGGNQYTSHNSSWHTVTGNPEEDMGYECDPEAEAEPGVATETYEADLAEADQSPGLQGTSVNALVTPDGCQVDMPVTSVGATSASNHVVKPDGSSCSDELGAAVDVMADILPGSQASVDETLDQEVNLDDIPTRLTPPFCEEELQRHIKNEQESNALLSEVVEDFTLVGDGFMVKEPAQF